MSNAGPLSTRASIAVSGVTAIVVMAGGVLIVERAGAGRRAGEVRAEVVAPVVATAPAPATVTAVVPSATTTAIAVVSATATATATATAVVTATVSAAPAASAVAPPVVGDPSALPPRRGYLRVEGPAEAKVFVNGALVGPPNTPIEVACGFGFVRLGIPPEKGPHPTWIAEGKSVVIACRAETIVPSR